MQLLYVWIEDYKNIKEQGFNFSSEFIFDYDKESGVLTIKDNPNYIEGFFNNDNKQNGLAHISNTTAIVGKNGSGKSSLLYHILQEEDNYIIVYLTSKEKKIIVYNIDIECTIINFSSINIIDTTDESLPEFVFYSPDINLNRNVINENYYF